MGSGGTKKHETYQTAPSTTVNSSPAGPSTDPATSPPPHATHEQPEQTSAEDVHTDSDQQHVPAHGEGDESSAADHAVDAADSATSPEVGPLAPDDLIVEPPPDVVTPIPQAPPEGVAAGTPVLVGGADLADSTATLISYSSPDGDAPREVLLATLDQEAEAKLLDALALNEEKLVPVQVEEEVTGRLPLDEQEQLYELTAKVAKSVNHKLKHGTEVPQHTKEYLAEAQTAVAKVLDTPGSTPDELQMAEYYKNWLGKVAHTIDIAGSGDKPYADVKIPQVKPYEHTGLATITKMVPAPEEDDHPSGLPASMRDASRIQAQIDATDGTTSWDGSSRSPASGKEYVADLGSGWSAVYRPYGANDSAQHEYTLRGQLEVHAPQGSGHGHELVRRLGDLHLVNRAMTHQEGEWTYLKNNIDAQGLADQPQVKAALAQAEALEEMQLQELFHTHADKAIGLDEKGLTRLAKSWQIEAAASCLPKKVSLVREAVAAASGHPDGAALAASPGYDPIPRASGGWLTWSRWDLSNNHAEMQKAWAGKSLMHSVGGGSLAHLLASGVLASTERRSVMGVSKGQGMSEQADKHSGGANSVFTRVGPTPTANHGPRLIWDDPPRILNNTSIYGYNSDQFGAINPAHSMHGLTQDPMKMANFTNASNEVMIKNGLDLLGPEAPTRIMCGSPSEKKEVMALLKKRGVTHLAGKSIDQVVQ